MKTLFSAYSNARQHHSDIDSMDKVYIKEIKIDQGPIIKYFKPAAMGRAGMQRRRMCHLEIVLDKRI
jgi:large subunit ribosomal protein L22